MNSCHPNHVKKAIAFSQATRILRICSDPATALSRCNELIEYLLRRGHGWRLTQLEVQRAMDAYRNPQQHIRKIDRAVYFAVQYHPGLPDITGTLKKFLPILYTSERMCMVFFHTPVVSFSQPKNLSQQLCRAKLQEHQKEAIQSKPYQGNRCQLCTAIVSASCVTSTSNGRTFHCRNQGTNCNTKSAVYVIMCDVCGMQYVGQTNNIKLRMNGHKSDNRKFLNGDFSKSDTSSLYSHIKSHDVKILKFQILEILENEGLKYTKDNRQLETSLDAKERHWIWKLETLTPKGLNVTDTFHSQNRSSRKKRCRFFTSVLLTHK